MTGWLAETLSFDCQSNILSNWDCQPQEQKKQDGLRFRFAQEGRRDKGKRTTWQITIRLRIFSLLSRYQCYTPSDHPSLPLSLSLSGRKRERTSVSGRRVEVYNKRNKIVKWCDVMIHFHFKSLPSIWGYLTLSSLLRSEVVPLVPLLEFTSIRRFDFHLALPHLGPVGTQNSSSTFLHTLHHGSPGIWICTFV